MNWKEKASLTGCKKNIRRDRQLVGNVILFCIASGIFEHNELPRSKLTGIRTQR